MIHQVQVQVRVPVILILPVILLQVIPLTLQVRPAVRLVRIVQARLIQVRPNTM